MSGAAVFTVGAVKLLLVGHGLREQVLEEYRSGL